MRWFFMVIFPLSWMPLLVSDKMWRGWCKSNNRMHLRNSSAIVPKKSKEKKTRTILSKRIYFGLTCTSKCSQNGHLKWRREIYDKSSFLCDKWTATESFNIIKWVRSSNFWFFPTTSLSGPSVLPPLERVTLGTRLFHPPFFERRKVKNIKK